MGNVLLKQREVKKRNAAGHVRGLQVAFKLFYFSSRNSLLWFLSRDFIRHGKKHFLCLSVTPSASAEFLQPFCNKLLQKTEESHKPLLQLLGEKRIKMALLFTGVTEPCLWTRSCYCHREVLGGLLKCLFHTEVTAVSLD